MVGRRRRDVCYAFGRLARVVHHLVADEAAQKIHKLTNKSAMRALFTADQMQSAVSADLLYPFVADVSICRERFTWSAALVRLLVLPMA